MIRTELNLQKITNGVIYHLFWQFHYNTCWTASKLLILSRCWSNLKCFNLKVLKSFRCNSSKRIIQTANRKLICFKALHDFKKRIEKYRCNFQIVINAKIVMVLEFVDFWSSFLLPNRLKHTFCINKFDC